MLEKIVDRPSQRYIDFSSIKRYSNGIGLAYCYNAVMKSTKAGKPFITLYLRDTAGVSIPGYVFDLKSPLLAGSEITAVVGKIVSISWQENYLRQIGLTLIIETCAIAENVPSSDYEVFTGSVDNLRSKCDELSAYFQRVLGFKVHLPKGIEVDSFPEYSSGRVGGVADYYYKIYKHLDALVMFNESDNVRLAATFLLYVLVHYNYIVAERNNSGDIALVTTLTERVSALVPKLEVGESSLELIHMFFGYEPKSVYVRTVKAIADLVKRVDAEFRIYETIPLTQEGNAGYGTIRRYEI